MYIAQKMVLSNLSSTQKGFILASLADYRNLYSMRFTHEIT